MCRQRDALGNAPRYAAQPAHSLVSNVFSCVASETSWAGMKHRPHARRAVVMQVCMPGQLAGCSKWTWVGLTACVFSRKHHAMLVQGCLGFHEDQSDIVVYLFMIHVYKLNMALLSAGSEEYEPNGKSSPCTM